MKINSLKTRVLVWFGSIVAGVLILFSLAFYYFLKQSHQLKLQTTLYEQAEQIEATLLDNKILKNSFDNLNVMLIKNDKIIQKNQDFIEDYSPYYPIKDNKFFWIESEEYIKGIYILILKKPINGKLIVATHNINNMVEDVEDTLLVIDPLLLLILLLLGNKLIDKILIPIKKITQTVQDITINNFSDTITVPKENDEIKALILSFNEMIKRLKKGVYDLDRFNTDVSHELKTPLTVIKGEIEVTLRKLREPNNYIKSFKTIAYEANQIEQIVDNLLLLTKYSKENIRETFETSHLDAIVLNAIEKYDITIKEKNLKLHIKKLEPIILKSNPLLLYTIFSNLIENAVKYTQNGKKITISLYQDKKIYFVIEDEGIGIAKEELSKVTERFYRVDSSRNKSIQGFGLGLSLVKNSVELLGGTMKITSTLGKGTKVCLFFKN